MPPPSVQGCPHWVFLIIDISQYSEGGILEDLPNVKIEAEELIAAVIESGLCQQPLRVVGPRSFDNIMQKITEAVKLLESDSKLLVVYMGHSYCESGSTWIVPSPGFKKNNCILLEDEIMAQATAICCNLP